MSKSIIKKCLICGNNFITIPSVIKRGEGKFCSKKCFGVWCKNNKKRNMKISKALKGIYRPAEFGKKISLSKKGIFHFNQRGKLCPMWKGGITKNNNRILIYSPNHQFCHKRDKYIFKYRLIVEKYFNRYLTQKEVVHHINGDTSNDRPENLYLFANQQDHTKFHRYPYNLQSNIIGFKV